MAFSFRALPSLRGFQIVGQRTFGTSRSNVGSNITELVGNTPIVRLNRITQGCHAHVYAKLEYMNPGGSIKDRIAVSMIRSAEDNGLISPKRSVLVEATRQEHCLELFSWEICAINVVHNSGNTGIGLAMAAAALGYRLILTMPRTPNMTERCVDPNAIAQTIYFYMRNLYFERACKVQAAIKRQTPRARSEHLLSCSLPGGAI
jgi:hypothetical protein